MKKIILFLVFSPFIGVYCNFENTFSAFRIRVNADVQKKAAEDLLIRLLGPVKSKLFELKISDKKSTETEKDSFSILKTENDDKVLVTGSNGVSLAWGVHYYLKNYCNCHISWDGDQLNIPDVVPSVNITIESVDKLRYYQNVCTSSYSFVWWDWSRWEREIDWMALNGINLALAFNAQEAIWQRVYDALGLEFNEFTGPAFLAWNRMGNLRNFSHGLTNNWHEKQLNLQHKILKRMRDLGITPVLPAFCGIVPRSFKNAYPLANLTKMSKWGKFTEDYCCPYLLSPNDALFSVVSRLFLREYINEFGTNHIYNCDTYNENTPASGDLAYLTNISKSIYNEISKNDPGAVWMVQGWMFQYPFWQDKERVEAFVTGVPIGYMLILDLESDLNPQYQKLDSYFGQPFIWCTLLNFGGQLGMYGHLSRVNKEVLRGRTFENSTMVGIGLTPEGIDQNYIMYEFTLESALRSTLVNLTEWVSQYALRRYGAYDKDVRDAWLILKDTAYNYRPENLSEIGVNEAKPIAPIGGLHISKNILTKLPSLLMTEPSWYDVSQLFVVFQKFLSASRSENVNSSDLFQHDLIDVTRQTIQFTVSSLYFQAIKEFALAEVDNFQTTSATFLSLLDELDRILGSGKKFLLGNWLEAAKSCARNENETAQYEFGARNQITLWGPHGEIRDYAAKQWSGLVSDYYKPRWKIFWEALNQSLVDDVPYNATGTKEKMFRRVEEPFGKDRKVYPTVPQGNPIEVVRNFNYTWGAKVEEILKNYFADEVEIKNL